MGSCNASNVKGQLTWSSSVQMITWWEIHGASGGRCIEFSRLFPAFTLTLSGNFVQDSSPEFQVS